jgi:hypothetical protein
MKEASMMRRTLVLAAVPVLLAGCQTWGPVWSEVTGIRYFHTDPNRSITTITLVDGKAAIPNRPQRSTMVDPGRRVLTLQGAPLAAGFASTSQDFTLDMEPCKRYYVNAQFANRLSPSDWAPVVDYVETIGGCGVAGK